MDWKRGPPVLVGEKVLWSGNGYARPESGVIKWIGNIPEISPDWCVGVELDVALPRLGGDGFWKERKLFQCRSKHGLLVPIEEIQKLATKAHSRPISSENYSHFKLDDSQLRNFTLSDLRHKPQKDIKKTEIKNRYSNSESKPIESFDSVEDSKKENRKSGREVFGGVIISGQLQQLKNQNVTPQEKVTGRKTITQSQSQRKSNTLNIFSEPKVNEIFEDSQTFDSKTCINVLKNMNEVAGYFKEIKEGDERFEKEEPTNLALYDAGEQGHSKPKKLFSFLKWFNKKQKQEPNLKLFKDSSATSSPMFPRRETSSCESIDTLFSTQTVRSFAYIPPTQYRPSAPPLDFDQSSLENICGDFSSQKNATEETESIYDKRKKRKAPEPPRLSRENSLPTTLERKKIDDFDGASTFHRRTVSESFKDKRAGSYCHVQGKRKAPPPPASPLYPNLQKLNDNQYPSLHKKKKPAPPPPETSSQIQVRRDVQKEKETRQPSDEPKRDLKDNGNEEKEEKKINQTPKDRLTKDTSLSPLPSRPWYKRSHRDSTGSNIIRKDLLKGFEKKKNKETDDWMPEVGFPRRSLSTESHSKFNIFSKLEKTEDKKKEEKRKSQISILTNISELDREAAEILRKEQAEEKKMLAANDAKYYSQKEIKEKPQEPDEASASAVKHSKASSSAEKNIIQTDKPEGKSNRLNEPQVPVDQFNFKEVKTDKNLKAKDENLKTKGELLMDKENNLNPDTQSNDNPKSLFSPNVLADLTNSSSPEKISKPNQSSSQARINFFNVQKKELNYLNEPWVCQKCTLENPGWRVFCEICSSIKPRFPINNSEPKTKTEPVPPKPDKPNELKSASEGPQQKAKPKLKPSGEEEEEEEEVETKAETIDELRKKRMNFFSSKLDTSESDKNEPKLFPDDSKIKLKKTAEELRDSFLEKGSCAQNKNLSGKNEEGKAKQEEEKKNKAEIKRKEEEEKNKAEIKRKEEEEKNKAEIKRKEEEEKNKAEIKRREEEEKNKAETKRKEEEEKNKSEIKRQDEEERIKAEIKRQEEERIKAEIKRQKEEERNKIQTKRKEEEEYNKPQARKEPEKKFTVEQKNNGSNTKITENSSTTIASKEPQEKMEKRERPNLPKEKQEATLHDVQNEEKVIEAYVVTKTIVLEDIIVKKPDRGKKVSASVQTKSSLTASPENKIMRPPPRTKKVTGKEMEPELYSESGGEKNVKTDEDLEELTSKLTQAEGLADFRAKIQTMPLNTEMNTVVVNRLLRKLEEAINCGDHFVAAGLAKELALMKINCSVTRQVTPSPSTSNITIDLYIEDKLSHQGPIPLQVSPTMSLLQLKKKIHQEFGIPLEVQRWILGKKLATDNNTTLESEGVTTDYCPLFLYLVAPDNRKSDKENVVKVEENTEEKLQETPEPTEENTGPKGKGWYYNYEEDHYSYCEDSESDSKSSGSDLNSTSKEITSNSEMPEATSKKAETESGVKKSEKVPVFDLKSKGAENDTGKELKFISVNFVKQKVDKLNKTFAENAKGVKPPLRSSRSPETWKCGICSIINSPGRLNCSSCSAKKISAGPNNTKIYSEKGGEQLKREVNKSTAVDDNIHYKALMELQDADLVPNSEPFGCSICLVDYGVGEGVTLKDCLHTFCRTCLVGTVQFSEDAEVKCPYLDETYSCPSVLQQREIKALVPKGIFELHLAKSVKEAENKIENAFHCKTPDCKGWCIYEDNVNQFRCPVCKFTNCLTCQAVHNGINCREYQERMRDASETDTDAKKTRDMLNEMVEKGEAMICPKCQVVLMKKWGCDWLKCSMCKTEICWVTRGFRWGPEGKGDTTGGCKCGVNGVKCHPKCNYCH